MHHSRGVLEPEQLLVSCSSYLVKHLLCRNVGMFDMKCIRSLFQATGVFFVFYSLMCDGILQMFPLKQKRFNFLAREDQLLYWGCTNPIYFLSAIAKWVHFGVKGPHYLPHVLALFRNIFQNISSFQHWKSVTCDMASYQCLLKGQEYNESMK